MPFLNRFLPLAVFGLLAVAMKEPSEKRLFRRSKRITECLRVSPSTYRVTETDQLTNMTNQQTNIIVLFREQGLSVVA